MSFLKKLRSHGWLIIINALIASLLTYRYYVFLPEAPTDILSITFIILATLSHMALLAAIVGVVCTPILLLPNQSRRILQSGIAAFFIVLIFIDSIVFAQYRFHINSVVIELILAGQVVSFPFITWLITIAAIITVWIAQWYLIGWLDRGNPKFSGHMMRNISFALVASLLCSNLIHIWAAAHGYQSITIVKRYLPAFHPATANSFMREIGWINEEELERQKSLTLSKRNDIRYPLEQIKSSSIDKPINIIFIVVDSWRHDTFNADNTPNMWQFSQKGAIFNHHLSTGNSTRSGIFGLFYGIPATYWDAMLNNRISPILMERLSELNYQFGIFASAHLHKPEFSHTVFTNIENLRMESAGETPAERDLDITNEWISWNKNASAHQPKFSFLFYDAAHGYDFPNDYPHRYEPMLAEIDYLKLNNNTDPIPFFNRYRTSIHYIDSLVGKVLDNLKNQNELNNTLIVITGDHSQEMNDNKQSYWGHGGNFTYAQVHVPFALIGPNVENLGFKFTDALSDHQNIAPTLLKNYLGVENELNTYTTGRSLFDESDQRQWVIAGNFNGYAVVSPEQILYVNGNGQYEFLDRQNRPLKGIQPDAQQLQEAIEMMSRFNR